ncbi:hypothetical protein H2198_009760 [Neophaeococcomyces mojaviensis]|uniref:Uncharacterized protein n=1 Tax=Neophaeococcomyces mojaviensis TaxID=3383035 RepID=A0ACC2ZTJ7_9EURO|nr:hypothetical protein H2198_009760 [Knufia sp. JES_112]
MRPSLILLSVFHFLAFLVAAHPFIIISTKIEVHHVMPTHIIHRRQGLLDQFESAVNSVLGIDTETSSSSAKSLVKATSTSARSTSSTKTVQTLAPPVTASATSTSSSRGAQTTSTSSDDDDDDTTSTTSDQTTSTDSSSTTTTDSTTTTTDSSTSTSAISTSMIASTTAQPTPTSSLANVQPTYTASSAKSNDNGNQVPAAGIAVAVIMILVIVLVSGWLVFKYNSRAQAWWASRQEHKRKERSYREALDGPAPGSTSLRQEALAGGSSKRRTMLQSFFAPATAKLGHGTEIKRKPVNWGAKSPATSGTTDSEKISFTASAAPMGRIERYSGHHFVAELDSTPVPPAPVQPVSPISLGRKESLYNLPPVSPLSTHTVLPSISERQAAKDLPELPPVPALPSVLHAKKGSDGVFRLA